MKKIIILGANGYIARNLYYQLCGKGNYEVALFDRQEKHFDRGKTYRQLNILDKESLAEIDFDVDIIFMMAGRSGSANGFHEYGDFIDINEKGLLNVLSEMIDQKSRAKIIFPSTRLVYKGRGGRLKENDEKEFKTIYAINKFSDEMYLQQFHNIYGLNYCIFRICLPYGTFVEDAISYGTINFMISKASKGEEISLFGDGSVRRTLTYIGDLCNILIEGAQNSACVNDVFNIGGEDYSLTEMAELISRKYKTNVSYVEWPFIERIIESGDTVFDDEKLNAILNYKMTMSFEDWVGR